MKRTGRSARRHSSTAARRLIGGLAIVAAVAVLLVMWSARHRGEDGGVDAPQAAPIVSAARDAAVTVPPVVAADARAVQPLSDAHATPADAARDSLLCETGLFAGVPRAWLVPLTLRGRVVDQDGAPLAGARIIYLPEASGHVLAQNAGPARLRDDELDARLPFVTTAADGSFALVTERGIGLLGQDRTSELTPGPALVVDDPRCAAYVHACPLGAAGEVDVGTLTMTAGAVITGRAIDSSGAPLADQRVRLGTPDPETSIPGIVLNVELPTALRVATTSADGSYTIRSAGRIEVTIVGPNGQPVIPRVHVVAVPVGASSEHGAEGTEVIAWHGRAAIEDLPPAAYKVGIRVGKDDASDPPDFVEVSLAAGETRAVTLHAGS